MRRRLVGLVLVPLLGCTNPVAPTADVAGTWTALRVESSTTINLSQHGVAVSGAGTYNRFVNPPTGTLTITGTYVRPNIKLTLHYDYGVTTQYAAVVADANHMAGLETVVGGATDSLAFTRQ